MPKEQEIFWNRAQQEVTAEEDKAELLCLLTLLLPRLHRMLLQELCNMLAAMPAFAGDPGTENCYRNSVGRVITNCIFRLDVEDQRGPVLENLNAILPFLVERADRVFRVPARIAPETEKLVAGSGANEKPLVRAFFSGAAVPNSVADGPKDQHTCDALSDLRVQWEEAAQAKRAEIDAHGKKDDKRMKELKSQLAHFESLLASGEGTAVPVTPRTKLGYGARLLQMMTPGKKRGSKPMLDDLPEPAAEPAAPSAYDLVPVPDDKTPARPTLADVSNDAAVVPATPAAAINHRTPSPSKSTWHGHRETFL